LSRLDDMSDEFARHQRPRTIVDGHVAGIALAQAGFDAVAASGAPRDYPKTSLRRPLFRECSHPFDSLLGGNHHEAAKVRDGFERRQRPRKQGPSAQVRGQLVGLAKADGGTGGNDDGVELHERSLGHALRSRLRIEQPSPAEVRDVVPLADFLGALPERRGFPLGYVDELTGYGVVRDFNSQSGNAIAQVFPGALEGLRRGRVLTGPHAPNVVRVRFIAPFDELAGFFEFFERGVRTRGRGEKIARAPREVAYSDAGVLRALPRPPCRHFILAARAACCSAPVTSGGVGARLLCDAGAEAESSAASDPGAIANQADAATIGAAKAASMRTIEPRRDFGFLATVNHCRSDARTHTE